MYTGEAGSSPSALRNAGHMDREDALLDKGVRPDGGEQIVLGHESSGPPHQVGEQIEGLGRERDVTALTRRPPIGDVHRDFPEGKAFASHAGGIRAFPGSCRVFLRPTFASAARQARSCCLAASGEREGAGTRDTDPGNALGKS